MRQFMVNYIVLIHIMNVDRYLMVCATCGNVSADMRRCVACIRETCPDCFESVACFAICDECIQMARRCVCCNSPVLLSKSYICVKCGRDVCSGCMVFCNHPFCGTLVSRRVMPALMMMSVETAGSRCRGCVKSCRRCHAYVCADHLSSEGVCEHCVPLEAAVSCQKELDTIVKEPGVPFLPLEVRAIIGSYVVSFQLRDFYRQLVLRLPEPHPGDLSIFTITHPKAAAIVRAMKGCTRKDILVRKTEIVPNVHGIQVFIGERGRLLGPE